jgi:hypothetical protein
VYIARAFARQAELEQAIHEIEPMLGPNVVRLRYSLEKDWSGDPAIFFRIVIPDRVSRGELALRTARQIEETLMQHLEPLEEWGVLAYFSYSNESEQAARHDKEWA